MGPCNMEAQKGCFAVSSMREFAILPTEAVGIITQSRSKLKRLIVKNIEVERRDTVSESLKAIRSARPKYEFRPALSEQKRSRLADTTACARDYDYFVFDSR